MRLLLDTCVVLWWLSSPGKINKDTRAAIAAPESDVFVSAAAIWEMSIKRALGRLTMPDNILEVLAQQRMETLPITAAHAVEVYSLEAIHQDPFDRMQIAQARCEDMVLVTRDERIRQYRIQTLMA